MDISIAYCGLVCGSCPIHLATLEQDKILQKSMREEIARQCSEIYGMTVTVDEVTDCDGCRANTGRIFSGCLKCAIRKCAAGKKIENCAFCPSYPCGELNHFFSTDIEAKARLDSFRES